MRDKLKNKDYFDKRVSFNQETNEKVKGKLSTLDSEAKARRSSDLSRYISNILFSCYSRGDSVSDMLPIVKQGIEAFTLRRNILNTVKDDLKPTEYAMWERLDLDSLFEYLTILSFAVALRFPKEEIANALKQIGHEGEDLLLDLVATYVGQGHGVKKLAFPKVWGDLKLTIFTEDKEEDQHLLLKHCVNHWYASMKDAGWHDSHEGAEGAYKGYWCFDIALVVMLLDIDDSLVQDHPHYPADLVKHFRATK